MNKNLVGFEPQHFIVFITKLQTQIKKLVIDLERYKFKNLIWLLRLLEFDENLEKTSYQSTSIFIIKAQ
jgi:hypothetical protein